MKSIFKLVLAIFLAFTCLSLPSMKAEEYDIRNIELPTPEAPNHFVYEEAEGEMSGYLTMYQVNDADVMKIATEFYDDSGAFYEKYGLYYFTIGVQYDYSLDDNDDWHYTAEWDQDAYASYFENGYTWIALDNDLVEGFTLFDLYYEEHVNSWLAPALKSYTYQGDGWESDEYDFDTKNHSLYIRCRYYMEWETLMADGAPGERESMFSDWSDTAVFGKGSTQEIPEPRRYEAPVMSDLQIVPSDEYAEHFELRYTQKTPDSVWDTYVYYEMSGEGEFYGLEAQVSIDNGEWQTIDIINSWGDWGLSEGWRYAYNDDLPFTDVSYVKLRVRYSGTHGPSDWTTLQVNAPLRVLNLKAQALDYKTIKLDWDPIENAQNYQIYRLNTKTDKWMKYQIAPTNTYTFEGVKTGLRYRYRVIANVLQEDGTVKPSKSSSTKSATALLEGEPVLTVKKASSTKFKLNWTAVEGATRYLVYRKSTTAGWKKVLTLGGDDFTYTTASMVPDTYTFMIKAGRYDSVERTQTNGSNAASGKAYYDDIELSTSKASSTSIKLSWKAVEGIKSYEVYRSTSKTGTYKKIKTLTTTSYTDKSLTKGKTYFYKIRGYRSVNNPQTYTEYSTVKSCAL